MDAKTAIALCGGPALYLLGNLLFKRATAGWAPLSHLAGLASLGLIAIAAPALSPLVFGATTAGLLVTVGIWEAISLRRIATDNPDLSH
jgi:low temperature requirement protein LtrA